MGGTPSVSVSEFSSLSNTVKALERKTSDYDTIKGKLLDVSSSLAKDIDYDKVAKKITDVSAYNQQLANLIAKNPGALGENLAKEIGKDEGVITRIWTGLQDNTTFAQTLSSSLTNDESIFKKTLRGDQGAPGELSSSKEAVKAKLYDSKYTLWCADGDICKVPVGNHNVVIGAALSSPTRMHLQGPEDVYIMNKKGLTVGKADGANGNLIVEGDIGLGGGWIRSPSRLHLQNDELLYLLSKSGVIIGKAGGASGDLTVEGTANSQDAKVNGWLKVGSWYLQEEKNGNLAFHKGDINNWAATLTPIGNLHVRKDLHGNVNQGAKLW